MSKKLKFKKPNKRKKKGAISDDVGHSPDVYENWKLVKPSMSQAPILNVFVEEFKPSTVEEMEKSSGEGFGVASKPFWLSIKQAKKCLFSRRHGRIGKIIWGYSICLRLFGKTIL